MANWSPEDLAAASAAMRAAGYMSFEELLAETEPDLHCYYYTFGSASTFPYQNGWVIVAAHDWEEAHAKFRQHFPDIHQNTINCAFFYDAKQWAAMDPEHNWPGYRCHAIYV